MSAIKAGDKVRFEWEHLEPVEGIVQYTPCASGDCWVIIAEALPIYGIGERPMHIQNFARATLVTTKEALTP